MRAHKNLWGWLVLLAVYLVLVVCGNYSFSLHDHNLFLLVLGLLSGGVLACFTLIYAKRKSND